MQHSWLMGMPAIVLISSIRLKLLVTGKCDCFTDNTGVFRDIKKRGKRKVLELDPAGRKIVEVSRSCN